MEGMAAVGDRKKIGGGETKKNATPPPQNVFATSPPKCFGMIPQNNLPCHPKNFSTPSIKVFCYSTPNNFVTTPPNYFTAPPLNMLCHLSPPKICHLPQKILPHYTKTCFTTHPNTFCHSNPKKVCHSIHKMLCHLTSNFFPTPIPKYFSAPLLLPLHHNSMSLV